MLVGNLIAHEPPVSLPPHQPALAETPEVHRGIGLGESCPCHDLAGGQRPVTKGREYAQPRRIAEPAKELRGQGE